VLGLLVAGLLFLQNLNDWPLWSASYDTNASYSGFILAKIGAAVLLSLLDRADRDAGVAGGTAVSRLATATIATSKAFTLRGLRSKEFFSSAVVGLSMAAATHWIRGGVLCSGATLFWSLGATGNQLSGFSEYARSLAGRRQRSGCWRRRTKSLRFDCFAIPFFQRLTGSRWIAVILPAFMWSFLHSNYPQEPPYIRGIEIGLFGIVAGLVMLRWGILATFDMALHGGCVVSGLAAGAVKQLVFQGFRRSGGIGCCGTVIVRGDFPICRGGDLNLMKIC